MKHHGRYELYNESELLQNIKGGEDSNETKVFFNSEIQRLKKHHKNSKRHSFKRKKRKNK